MGERTNIEWCDSTVNPVMGCDGCELWVPDRDIKICYAGQLHEMRGGQKGYADEFLVPKLFPGRMAAAARWRDLAGKVRPDKPWLGTLPRLVFISDMGDALSASVPFPFLLEEVVRVVGAWPHVGMWLTKKPERMAAFAVWLAAGGVEWPANLWVGASITGPGQGARVRHLRVVPAAVRFLSVEPVLRDPGELQLSGVSMVILGGESGHRAGATDVDLLRSMVAQVRAAGARVFVKQLGSNVVDRDPAWARGRHPIYQPVGGLHRISLGDRKGGDFEEWPEDLRVREMPEVQHAA